MKTNRVLLAVIASLLVLGPVNLPAITTPLTVNCPSNIMAAATSSNGANVTFSVTTSGGGGPCGSASITVNPPSGSLFPIGTTTVTAMASNNCNTSDCSFTVTITNAVEPPIVLTCSSNITTTATSSNGAVVYFTATASGGCSQPSVYSYPASGSTFAVGMTTVTTTASDSCGNSTNCSFTVTVNRGTSSNCVVSITCPPNITVTNTGPTNVFFAVTASDTCGGIPTIVSVPSSGSTFPIGTTLVTNTAFDANGSNTCYFTVSVIRPTCFVSITCSPNITVTNSGPTNVFFTTTASDTCGGIPTIVSVPPSGSTFPIGTTTVTNTAFDANGTTHNRLV